MRYLLQRALCGVLLGIGVLSTPSQAHANLDALCKPTEDSLVIEVCNAISNGAQIEAIVSLEALRDQYPKAMDVRQLLKTLYLWNNRIQSVPELLEEMVVIEPENQAFQVELAKLYISLGSAERAIPLYEALSVRQPENVGWWRELVTIYGWTGRQDELTTALEVIYRLDPRDHNVEARLAQQYEWTGQGERSIPLLQSLIERSPNDAALGFRLARQLADAGEHSAAIEQLQMVVQGDSSALEARYLLAQLTHWTPEWTVAYDNYEAILEQVPEHAEAQRYLTMLDKDHGPNWNTSTKMLQDSNDVLRLGIQVESSAPLTGWARPQISYIHHYLSEERPEFVEALTAHQDLALVGVLLEPVQGLRITPEVGVELLLSKSVEPVWGITLQGAKWGVYPIVRVRHQSTLTSALSVFDKITENRGEVGFYAEPVSWWQTSAMLSMSRLSDNNQRTQLFVGTWWVPFSERWILRPGLTGGYDGYKDIKPNADPYYTADNQVVLSPGVDVGRRFGDKLTLELGYSRAFAWDGVAAHNGRGSLVWAMTDTISLDLRAARDGSPEYTSTHGSFGLKGRF